MHKLTPTGTNLQRSGLATFSAFAPVDNRA